MVRLWESLNLFPPAKEHRFDFVRRNGGSEEIAGAKNVWMAAASSEDDVEREFTLGFEIAGTSKSGLFNIMERKPSLQRSGIGRVRSWVLLPPALPRRTVDYRLWGFGEAGSALEFVL